MRHHLFIQAQTNDPVTWAMIGLGAFVLVYLAFLRPMMRGKKSAAVDPPSARPGGMGQQRALERDMQHVLVEYEKMIRNMTAGVDTRAAKLEELLKQADERIATLRAATAAAGASGVASSPAAPGRPDSPSRHAPADSGGPDPRHVEVYTLADQGMSAKDVARKLGRPNGEIELILALRSGRE